MHQFVECTRWSSKEKEGRGNAVGPKTRQVGGNREIGGWVEEGDMCGKRRDRRMGKNKWEEGKRRVGGVGDEYKD